MEDFEETYLPTFLMRHFHAGNQPQLCPLTSCNVRVNSFPHPAELADPSTGAWGSSKVWAARLWNAEVFRG